MNGRVLVIAPLPTFSTTFCFSGSTVDSFEGRFVPLRKKRLCRMAVRGQTEECLSCPASYFAQGPPRCSQEGTQAVCESRTLPLL